MVLQVVDVFKAAINSVPQDSLKSGDPALKDLYEGVVGTEAMLKKVQISYLWKSFWHNVFGTFKSYILHFQYMGWLYHFVLWIYLPLWWTMESSLTYWSSGWVKSLQKLVNKPNLIHDCNISVTA